MISACIFQTVPFALMGKRRWMIAVALLLFLALALGVGCAVYNARQSTLEMMYAMYSELETMPDFDSLNDRDGVLFLSSQKEGTTTEVTTLPLCLEALSSGRIKSVKKIGDDVFFILHGVVDNYSGYVLSKDTVIDLNELDSVTRELKYEFGLRCYSFYSR